MRMTWARGIALILIITGAALGWVMWMIFRGPVDVTGSPVVTTPPPPVRDPGTVIVVADVWPPYNCQPGAEPEGFVVDIVRAVFPDHRVEYRLLSWKRALEAVRAGVCDGALCASPTEGAGLVLPEQEIWPNRPVFVVRKGHPWRFAGPDSLQKVRLGAIVGYDYCRWIDDYLMAHERDPMRVQMVTGETALEQNIRKLIDQRIDAVIDNEPAIRWQARHLGVEDRIEVAGSCEDRQNLYVAFTPSERGRMLAKRFSTGLAGLRSDGSLTKMLARYHLSDWRQTAGADGR
jgi:polar amino acid transport system substrate-binding protein